MAESLDSQARRFATETSELLNGTVTDGVRISSLTTPSGARIMGAGLKKSQPEPSPIPISPSGTKPCVYLYLFHSYGLDPEGLHLTMSSSTLSVYTSEQMEDDQLVVGIDYIREPANRYPGSHMHVSGERSDLDAIYLGDERRSRKLRDLHLPVGGRRFRPSLEDVVEFMVTEDMVAPREGWRQVLDQSRERWFSLQLQAAVRRNQEVAASALRTEGWAVSDPEQ